MNIQQFTDNSITNTCHSTLSFTSSIFIIILFCLLGLIWAIYNYKLVISIDVTQQRRDSNEQVSIEGIGQTQQQVLVELGQKISQGAKQFLKQEYFICMIFASLMFLLIYQFSAEGMYTAMAFLIGGIVSMLCGAVGMLIATRTNFRTAFCAQISLSKAFRTAYRGGCAIGFALVSLGLLVLLGLIIIFKSHMNIKDSIIHHADYKHLFQAIAGYGLGGSFIALFGRVGGGIYTKAADVGADLVGKLQIGLPQDSPKNPATIADNVGDNVGDVAGMSADLFGSFAQSTCASLVISSAALIGNGKQCTYQIGNLMYPLNLIAFGIFLCIFVSMLSTHFLSVSSQHKIQSTLKKQLLISTLFLLLVILFVAKISFPSSFLMKIPNIQKQVSMTAWTPYLCSIVGLVSGMIIAGFTQYFTSHNYPPVRQLANTCKAGPASNVTLGLALGYFSTLIPALLISLAALISNKLMGYYGVSLAALGMLSNLPLSLAIDGYGPISDNAGGIAQMADMGQQVRKITDGLDAAGNTTAAIGKGFAIGSAALVSLSLFGGFLHNTRLQQKINKISLLEPQIFAGLVLGAMLPYVFSAFTIKSVGKAAFGMVQEVRKQIRHNPGILNGTVQPDYKACIKISTRASLIEMIPAGALVIITPLALGFIFGPVVLAGFLPGSLVSGVQMAISAANTGGAWDNAKKYIQSGGLRDDMGEVVRKGSQIHKAAVVGDTVGDPLKDTSGPSLNILIKLMAILSLIFGSKFAELHSI